MLLKIVLAAVDDIDLYVGGLMEDAAVGSIAGPTLNCLMGEHFSKLKYSDRFFYELGGQPNSFTAGITYPISIFKYYFYFLLTSDCSSIE